MGPLAGYRFIEFAGIGPGPMAAMLLADLGATVLRLDRTAPSGLGVDIPTCFDLLARGRRSVALDLKNPAGRDLALRLLDGADGLIEGFRPGTMERLGLGPDEVRARNPQLVYGRVTGFGQAGPLASAAGHDINYIALTGALDAIGRAGGPPTLPLNLVGDFAGGSLYLVVGMLSALLERGRSGLGQVVDAAIVDGASHLMTMIYGLAAAGLHGGGRGGNLLDSGSPIYDVYECADGRWVSVGAIEEKFRATLFERLGLDLGPDDDVRARLAATFRTRDRDAWCRLLEGTDACFAPVLTMAEAPQHAHNHARATFLPIDGVTQPAPAPRFDRTVPDTPAAPVAPGTGGREALAAWGLPEAEIDRFVAAGAVHLPGSTPV